MRVLDIDSTDRFNIWHEEEFKYLQALQKRQAIPESEDVEKLRMEYVLVLKKLEEAE